MALSQLFWDVLMPWNLKPTYFSLKMIHFLSLNIWYVICCILNKILKFETSTSLHSVFIQICTVSQLFWNRVCIYVMYCQVWWPILEIGALHLTHPSAHTHTLNTHPEQWAAIAPTPGEQLGVWCLAQGHLSHGIEGRESAVHSQSPPSIPARPEFRTHNLWITSLTL